jgi:serine/threonine protein kinase
MGFFDPPPEDTYLDSGLEASDPIA